MHRRFTCIFLYMYVWISPSLELVSGVKINNIADRGGAAIWVYCSDEWSDGDSAEASVGAGADVTNSSATGCVELGCEKPRAGINHTNPHLSLDDPPLLLTILPIHTPNTPPD